MIPAYYLPGSSLLHRFDPRAKLIFLVVFVTVFFLPLHPVVPAVYIGALSCVMWACLGGREMKRSVLAIAPFFLVICVLTPVFNRTGKPIWSPFGFPLLTDLGLKEAIRLVERFAGITLAFFMVFRTVAVEELALALRWFGLSYRASLVITISFRFVPSLFAVYQGVQDAHALRAGLERRRGFIGRTIPVLISVIIQAVRGIPALAMALEARGLGRSNPRTQYRGLPDGKQLVSSMAVVGGITIILLAPLALPS